MYKQMLPSSQSEYWYFNVKTWNKKETKKKQMDIIIYFPLKILTYFFFQYYHAIL